MPPAGQVQISLVVNSANYTQGLKDASRQMGDLGRAAKSTGQSTVGDMQAASAAIRGLENPLNVNIRTLARFAAQSETLSKIFQAAFPVVGILAAGAAIAKVGTEVAKFIKAASEMPKTITAGFDALNLTQKSTIDQLQLTNDKLDNAHAKFEHKGTNQLAIQADEARIAMDKYAESITNSNAKLNELLSKNHLSAWAMLTSGQQGTADREGTAKYFTRQADSNAYDLANAVPGSPEEATAKRALEATQQAQLDEARKDLATRQAQQGQKFTPGNAANIADDKGTITTILNSRKEQAALLKNAAAESQKQADDAAKSALEDAKAAARKRLQAMEEALHQEELAGNVTVKMVFDYWAARTSAFAKGSEQYNEVVQKQAAAAVEGAAKAHEAITKAIAGQKRDGSSDENGVDINNRYNKESQQDALKTNNEQNQGFVDNNQTAIDTAKNDAREQEAVLTEAAGESISRYSAALETANIHAKEYVTIQESLVAIENIRQMQQATNPNKETDKNLTDAQNAVANAAATRQIQIGQDNRNINGPNGSASVGFTDALDDFVRASQDAATQMRELTTNTLKGLNETILSVISTPHMTGLKTRQAFGNYGAGLAKDVAGVGLQKTEGTLLGTFGFGGAMGKMGTQANPMWTRMADSIGGSTVGSIGSSIGKMFGIGTGRSGPGQAGLSSVLGNAGEAFSNDQSNGGISTDVSEGLKDMIPFLASGGPINGPAIVGEQGPELFVPGSAGSIIPNHKLSSSTSGSNGHTFNIDARGSNDPAQVNQQITMALRQAAPMISAHTISAQKESQMRQPPGSRK